MFVPAGALLGSCRALLAVLMPGAAPASGCDVGQITCVDSTLDTDVNPRAQIILSMPIAFVTRTVPEANITDCNPRNP